MSARPLSLKERAARRKELAARFAEQQNELMPGAFTPLVTAARRVVALQPRWASRIKEWEAALADLQAEVQRAEDDMRAGHWPRFNGKAVPRCAWELLVVAARAVGQVPYHMQAKMVASLSRAVDAFMAFNPEARDEGIPDEELPVHLREGSGG